MKTFSKYYLFALVVVAMLSSCARPYATFQKTTPERFAAKQSVMSQPAAVQSPIAIDSPLPPVVTSSAPVEVTGMETVAPAPRPATVDAALDQLEAVASAKAGPTESHKIAKRVARIRTLMAALPAKSTVNETSTAPKLNLMQRMAMKSIDKKIQKKLAPKQPMAATSILTIGAVLVIVGLVLILATSSGGLGAGILVAGAIVLLIGLL